jgi:hypothetical protein
MTKGLLGDRAKLAMFPDKYHKSCQDVVEVLL